MAEIKLLSIKRNTEASYFYDQNSSATLDSNKNEVVQVQADQTTLPVSQKDKKREEKRSKKEQKEREKELKQLEKEKKKSLKTSRKDIVGSVDTSGPHDRVKPNGDAKTGRDFPDGFYVGEASKDHQDKSLTVNDEVKNYNGASGLENDATKRELEEPLNQHEQELKQREEPLKQNVDSSEVHEEVSNELNLSIKTNEDSVHENVGLIENVTTGVEHEINIKGRGITNGGHNVDQSELDQSQFEETIRPEDAQTTQEAPPDSFFQPVASPGILEPTGGELVEIEISEVADVEVDPSSSDEVVVAPQDPPHVHSPTGESEIIVSTVQHVESNVDVNSFFAEDHGPVDVVDKEEARKSVRFQDETEEIGCSDSETEDHEHASLNLGGDFTETDDSEQKRTLEPSIEIVEKEERQTVESCVDLNNVFASSERLSNDTDEVSSKAERNHVAGLKLNGSAKVNGKATVEGQTKMARFEEIDLNGSNEHKNTAERKKEKRKRSKLVRCCFP